ncbi:MAG: beta-lactamase family protein [Chloroflexi bacterium]|nr:beta-lactamase family protein [Chloroflexota bacterium]
MNTHSFAAESSAPGLPGAERHAQLLAACPRLEPIFRRYAERQQMPGVAYGVIVDGELVFTHGFGVRDVTTPAPPDADSVYRIASMTKSFAALAIIKLRDAGSLQLAAPAATYVPELASLRYPTADSAPLTVQQLLTMSAGWPQDDPWADRQLYIGDDDLSRLFRDGVTFSNPPGVVFEYSNYAYIVLGRIIANVAGVSALDYITREILQPLGMTATTWQPATVPAAHRAPGYRWEDEQWKAEPLLPSGGDVAAFAGISSSVRDLARWVALFQSAWPARDEPETGLVRRSSLREMQQVWRMYRPVITERELGVSSLFSAGGYGYGLSIAHNGRYESVGHGGGVPGFGSHMRWAPAYGVGIVALANVTYANVHAACADALDELLQASQAQPRPPHPSDALLEAHAQVICLLTAWDDGLADTLFAGNFFLDSDRPHWQRRLDELRRDHGALHPDGVFEVENSLRGRWRMAGERGWCWVFITLSPTVPPRVQHLQLTSTLPPSPAMQSAAARLAALVSKPTRSAWQRLVARDANREALWERVRLAHVVCGACTAGELLAGDGAASATFRFVGEKCMSEVELTLDAESSRLRDAVFRAGR